MENHPNNGMELKPAAKLKRNLWKPLSVGMMALCGIFLVQSYLGGDKGRLEHFQWRQLILVEPEMVAGEDYLLDFPLRIHLIQDELKHIDQGGKVLHPKGLDIQFTDDDGASQIPFQIQSYDHKKGELIAWVNIDTLFPSKKNYCFLYFCSEKEVQSPEFTQNFRMRGHFIEGGKKRNALKNKLFSEEWLQTEVNNHENDQAFVKLGPIEELDPQTRVDYGYFKAGLKGGALILLEWSSKAEKDNEYFQVQRSLDGRNYQNLGKLGGSGNTSFELRYSFSDPQPLEDQAYYRLKQVGRNGTFVYTSPVHPGYDLHDQGLQISGITPNPFNEFFVAEYTSSTDTDAEITIYNGSGEVVEQHIVQVAEGSNSFVFKDKYELEKGAYVFSIMGPKRKLFTREVRKTYDPITNTK